jgi:prepilin-type processing-associated H-X9-DG protein
MLPLPSNGAFQLENPGNRGVALRQITDGTSNTLLVGDKHVPLGTFGQGGLDSSLYNGDTLSSVRPAGILYPLAVSDTDWGWKFGSSHTGVCQFVFVDGHVQALSNGIAPVTLGLLADASDGKVIPDF